jgi:5-methylcytosine-specific restriction endonuclease McrA
MAVSLIGKARMALDGLEEARCDIQSAVMNTVGRCEIEERRAAELWEAIPPGLLRIDWVVDWLRSKNYVPSLRGTDVLARRTANTLLRILCAAGHAQAHTLDSGTNSVETFVRLHPMPPIVRAKNEAARVVKERDELRLKVGLLREEIRVAYGSTKPSLAAAGSPGQGRLDPQRSFSKLQRQEIYLRSNGHCSGCGQPLDSDWHADHIVPHSRGGRTEIVNGQALCQPCNSRKHAKVLTVDEP